MVLNTNNKRLNNSYEFEKYLVIIVIIQDIIMFYALSLNYDGNI